MTTKLIPQRAITEPTKGSRVGHITNSPHEDSSEYASPLTLLKTQQHIHGLQRTIGNRQTQQFITAQHHATQHNTIQRDSNGLHGATNRLEFAQESMEKAQNGMSASAFVNQIMPKVNAQLAASGVRQVTAVQDLPGSRKPNEHGEFNPMTWQIVYNPNPTLANLGDYDRLANTIYHESRHAEQFFKMMQLLANRGLDAAAITRVTNMNGNLYAGAIGDAVARKDEANDWNQAIIANVKGWYTTIFDMNFDQAVQNHATAHGTQTTRFEGENQEKKDWETARSDYLVLANGGHALYQNMGDTSHNARMTTAAQRRGEPYITFVTNIIQAAALGNQVTVEAEFRGISGTLLAAYNDANQRYLAAHTRYTQYAHEQDAYAAGDSIDRVLTEMRKTNIAIPALPVQINRDTWKTAITIQSGIFGMNNSGGKHIKKITDAIPPVVAAHAQAVQDQSYGVLYKPLVDLQNAIDTWLEKKEGKLGAHTVQRRTAANALRLAVSTYLDTLGFRL